MSEGSRQLHVQLTRMNRRERERLAYGLLITARDASRLLGRPDKRGHLQAKLTDLRNRMEALLDHVEISDQPIVNPEQQAELVANAGRFAVLIRARNWADADITAQDIEVGPAADGVNTGETLAADGFDALGKLMLPSADAAGWAAALVTEAAAGDPDLTAAVTVGKYLLHPTPLLFLQDVTRVMGQAVYEMNLRELAECTTAIRDVLVHPEPAPAARQVDVLEDWDDPFDPPGVFHSGTCSLTRDELIRYAIDQPVTSGELEGHGDQDVTGLHEPGDGLADV